MSREEVACGGVAGGVAGGVEGGTACWRFLGELPQSHI